MTIATPPVVSMKAQREAMRDGKITGSHCKSCKHDQIAPMARCPKCHGRDIEVRTFSNTGVVVSHTIQSVAAEQFLNETPFAFAIIKLDDGPKITGWIPWISKPKDLAAGQKVEYVPSYKAGMQFEKR